MKDYKIFEVATGKIHDVESDNQSYYSAPTVATTPDGKELAITYADHFTGVDPNGCYPVFSTDFPADYWANPCSEKDMFIDLGNVRPADVEVTEYISRFSSITEAWRVAMLNEWAPLLRSGLQEETAASLGYKRIFEAMERRER